MQAPPCPLRSDVIGWDLPGYLGKDVPGSPHAFFSLPWIMCSSLWNLHAQGLFWHCPVLSKLDSQKTFMSFCHLPSTWSAYTRSSFLKHLKKIYWWFCRGAGRGGRFPLHSWVPTTFHICRYAEFFGLNSHQGSFSIILLLFSVQMLTLLLQTPRVYPVVPSFQIQELNISFPTIIQGLFIQPQ